MAVTAVLRLLAALLVGSVLLINPGINGAVIGLAAWMLAYLLEVMVLGWRLRSR